MGTMGAPASEVDGASIAAPAAGVDDGGEGKEEGCEGAMEGEKEAAVEDEGGGKADGELTVMLGTWWALGEATGLAGSC